MDRIAGLSPSARGAALEPPASVGLFNWRRLPACPRLNLRPASGDPEWEKPLDVSPNIDLLLLASGRRQKGKVRLSF